MAESPWGPISVSDAHVHFFSPNFFQLLAAQKPGVDLAAALGWEVPDADESAVQLGNRWAEELSNHGVDRSVLIASHPADAGSVSAVALAHPTRFFGFTMFDPMHQDAAAVLNENPGIRGICLFPALHRYSLHDPKCADAIRQCAGRAAVFVHCGILSLGFRRKLGIPTVIDPRYSNPLEVELLAHANPDVRFIIPHFGAGLFREALMVASQCPNVYLDTSSSNSWMKIEGLDLRTVLHRSMDTLGYKRLLFGTDSSYFPRGWNIPIFEEQAKALYELGLSKEEAEFVLGGNLVRILDFS